MTINYVSCLLMLVALGASAAAAETPNILFAISDDQSFPHASAYGCQWVETPAFDRVAREGLLFTRAYTPNAKCAPSRSCVLTGRYSWQLKDAVNHFPNFPAEFKVYTEALADAGWHVGKTGKGWAPGRSFDAEGKERHLAGSPFDSRKAPPPAKAISGNDYAANFVEFLDAGEPDQPWCFWYGATEPHRAYEYRVGARLADKQLSQIDQVPGYWPDNEVVRNDMLDYAFEIEHFDRHLGRMLETLEERGVLDNTLVIVTSDNGMPFPRVKGQEYERSNHLPLAIRWPAGIEQPGRRVDEFVSFVDFAPTFVEVAGLEWQATGMAPVAGISLTDIFLGQPDPRRDALVIGKERHDVGRPHDWGYPIRGLLQDEYLYLHNFEPSRWPAGNPETGYLNTDGSPTKTEVLRLWRTGENPTYWELCFGKRPAEELYHIAEDPECLQNLMATAADRAAAMQEELFSRLRASGDRRMAGRGEEFEAYEYSDPRTRNFYERYRAGESVQAGWVNESDFEPEPLD